MNVALTPSDVEDAVEPEVEAAAATSSEGAKRAVLVAVAASAAAAWMVGGAFEERATAAALALVAATAGALAAGFGGRVGGYLALPGALVLGALACAQADGGPPARAVRRALDAGGLGSPPTALLPGWRLLLVVLFAAVGAAAVSAASTWRSSKAALVVPLPLVLAASLLQAPGREVGAALGAGVGLAIALVLAGDGGVASAGSVDPLASRARRAVVQVGVVGLALVVVGKAGILLPEPDTSTVTPARRPPAAPPLTDRVLFRVTPAEAGPWRLGILDPYDGEAFLLPARDTAKLVDVRSGQALPADGRTTTAGSRTVEVTVVDTPGADLPRPADTVSVTTPQTLDLDPIADSLRHPDGAIPDGFTYAVQLADPPAPGALAAATATRTPADEGVPAAPQAVAELLADAPAGALDRLQRVRQALYEKVIAAGPGSPVAVPPSRVDAMLTSPAGAEATPFEITAAEVLLARWAGLPARLAFGFQGGEPGSDGLVFRPIHAATYLEVRFDGIGWVPIVGVPPRAKASLSDDPTKKSDLSSATDELALTVYVPIDGGTDRPFFEVARDVAGIALLVVVALALGWAALAPVARVARRARRRRWARAVGPRARIWAAYAEVRDLGIDLRIGEPAQTPLAWVRTVAADDEHRELAWLVTRSTWGDLSRGAATEADAEAADAMAASVRRRLLGARTLPDRVAASVRRASLRSPWSDELPNLWATRSAAPGPAGRRRARRPQGRLVSRTSSLALVVLAALVLAGCADAHPVARRPQRLDPSMLPTEVAGLTLGPAPEADAAYRDAGLGSLVAEGTVRTLERGDAVDGSVQLALLRASTDAGDPKVQEDLSTRLGAAPVVRHVGTTRVLRFDRAEQRLWLWFPPTANLMEVIVLRRSVSDSDAVVDALITHQLGLSS